MAFLNVSTASGHLGKSIQYNAFVPDGGQTDVPVFILMHGLSDDYTQWQRFTEAERFAAERGVALIMPDGGRSFYTDMKYGGAYYSCILEDVLDSARNLFPISRRRERTFTAGLSMGGYGAAKLARRNPDKFAGFIALSGCLDIAKLAREHVFSDFALIWGDDYARRVPDSDDDTIALLRSVKDSGKPMPRIYVAVGDDDFLLEHNHNFRDAAFALGYDMKYEQGPGNHHWEFWNRYLPRGLDFILEGME
jgi:S-formylglutathione hydrolase FrmB